MPDQTFAARLRERAEMARRAAATMAPMPPRVTVAPAFVAVYADEADAIADALEAAQRFRDEADEAVMRVDEKREDHYRGLRDGLQAALDRLDGREEG